MAVTLQWSVIAVQISSIFQGTKPTSNSSDVSMKYRAESTECVHKNVICPPSSVLCPRLPKACSAPDLSSQAWTDRIWILDNARSGAKELSDGPDIGTRRIGTGCVGTRCCRQRDDGDDQL